MINLTVLASSSGANAVLATTSRTTVLLDCGLPAQKLYEALTAHGYDPAQIDAVIVTHEHADHSAGLRSFVKQFNVPVLMSGGTFAAIPWGFVPVATGPIIGDLSVWLRPVSHDAVLPCGIVLRDRDGDKAGYFVDLGEIPSDMPQWVEGCRTLLIESNHDTDMLAAGPHHPKVKERVAGPLGHLSNDQVAEFLQDGMPATVERLILGHLSRWANTPQLASAVAMQALRRRGMERRVELEVEAA